MIKELIAKLTGRLKKREQLKSVLQKRPEAVHHTATNEPLIETKLRVKVPKQDFQLEKEKQEIERYSDFLAGFGDNHEQKRAVVSDSNRILVLAGAGSGKTRVLTERFIHLVKNKGVPKERILAVTFTKAATKEMQERIAKSLEIKADSLKPQVRTFHSFCFSVLKQNEQFDLITEKDQEEIVRNILVELSKDEEVMESLYNYIKDNLVEKIIKKEDGCQREPRFKGKPNHFGEKKIKTMSGMLVRSKSERDIANFLTALGVNWEYEKPTDWADAEFFPDFTIGDDIYIEHWAYNKNTPEFNQINKKKYLEHRQWKEAQFKKHKKVLISIEESEMLDLKKLQNRIKVQIEGLLNRDLQEKTLLETLEISPTYKKALEKFIDEILEIINLAKSSLLSIEQVKDAVKDEKKEKVVNFYGVLLPVMERYELYLKQKDFGKKDFNDLVKNTIELLKNNPSRKDYYSDKMDYLLVDEFQDVSLGEVELLKLLIKKKTNFFAVGDDWQSIYGWRGSDVGYILNFEKHFSKAEKIVLPYNYRSTKNIVEASSHFIQQSKKHYKKDIKCSKENNLDESKIIQLNARDDYNAARYILYKIEKLMQEDPSLRIEDFLVLYRSHRNMFGYKQVFTQNHTKIPIKTIHGSKGLEAKYVFVLGLKGGIYGFPNVYADKDIKRVILDIPVEDKEEEERRIFYVAMTRAKKKLFLISEDGNESEFLADIPKEYKFIYSGEK